MPTAKQFLEHASQKAKAARVALCVGVIEETGRKRLSNAAYMLDAQGKRLGVHRKCFLWDRDNRLFEQGNSIEPFETPFGRVGMIICADARMPEILATLAYEGASLILQPTAWVNAGTRDAPWNPQPAFMIASRAREFGFPVASASKFGQEAGMEFVGRSLICDATGQVLASCSGTQTELIVADVQTAVPRRPEATPLERCQLLSERRAVRPRRDVPDLRVCLAPTVARSSEAALPALVVTRPVPQEPGATGESIVSSAGVRIATLKSSDVKRFAPARLLALQGVHLIVVRGEQIDLTHARTRAAENRVFVLTATPQEARLFDPRGCEVSRHDWRDSVASWQVAVSEAACKQFAPGTDTFAGRRPILYRC